MAASVLAKEALDQGNNDEAAKLYDRAAKYDPSEPGYLYSAARSKQKAGHLAAAEQDYVNVLKYKALPAKLAEKARSHLLEVRSARAARLVAELEAKKKAMNEAPVAPRPAPKPAPATEPAPAAKPAPAPAKASMMPFAILGVGAVVGLTGAGVFAMGISQRSDLDAKLPETGDGTILYEDAMVEKSDIETKKTIAAALGGVGVVGIGVGVWMLLSQPETPQSAGPVLSPAFGGRGVAVSFTF